MKVVFINQIEHKNCTKCDDGRCNLPLIVDKHHDVVIEDDEFYEFMGWGSMKFRKTCFSVVDTSPIKYIVDFSKNP